MSRRCGFAAITSVTARARLRWIKARAVPIGIARGDQALALAKNQWEGPKARRGEGRGEGPREGDGQRKESEEEGGA